MLTKAKVEKHENQIVSWREDFYFNEDEFKLLENEYRQQLSKMYDLNPSFRSILPAFLMIEMFRNNCMRLRTMNIPCFNIMSRSGRLYFF
jgi:hypothetical protein